MATKGYTGKADSGKGEAIKFIRYFIVACDGCGYSFEPRELYEASSGTGLMFCLECASEQREL